MSTRRAEPGGSIRLVFAGELDLAARSHLETALDSAQGDSSRVLLDLGALTFIDCACIASLFGAARRGHQEGAQLVLLEMQGQVKRLLHLVGTPAGVTVLDHDDFPDRPQVGA